MAKARTIDKDFSNLLHVCQPEKFNLSLMVNRSASDNRFCLYHPMIEVITTNEAIVVRTG